MGAFRHTLTVLSADGSRGETVEALVDTGATFTWLPASLLQRLGIAPTLEWEFQTANGRVVRLPVADVVVQLNGERHRTPVVFGGEAPGPLLGVVTLEVFSLGVDPVNERLVPVRGLALMGRRGGADGSGCRPALMPCTDRLILRWTPRLGSKIAPFQPPILLTSPTFFPIVTTSVQSLSQARAQAISHQTGGWVSGSIPLWGVRS